MNRPVLIKNLQGVVLAFNQEFLQFRKITSEHLLGLTAYDFLPKAQADLHTLAAQHLLTSTCASFEYEGYNEAVPIKIKIRRVQFQNEKTATIMMEITLQITLPKKLEPKNYLTNREHSILQLLVEGNSQKKIALLLNLSRHTIAGYIKSIYIKLDVKSSTQACLIALTRLGMRSRLL